MSPRSTPAPEWPALSDLVDDVVDVRAAIAALQAREARLLASAVDLVAERTEQRRAAGRRSHADIPLRKVSAELGLAMRVSDRAVQGRIGDASTLVERFPTTLTAWEHGAVDAAHVAAILDAGAGIGDDDRRARYEYHALRIAETESATRLRVMARALAAQIDPEGVQDRMADAESRRMVRVLDRGDGTARLLADMSAPLACGILDRLTEMARVVREGSSDGDSAADSDRAADHDRDSDSDRAADDDGAAANRDGAQAIDARSMDQLRVDILCDMLLGAAPVAHGDGLAAIRARVQVTVPALTLAGHDGGPALLAGAGPIDRETARRLAGAAPGWDRVFTDRLNGEVLSVDRYRPNAAITRFLAARDEHCRFPGCRRAVHGCDIDHTLDAARGGATSVDNLAHFCRRHHTLKHESAWSVRQVGAGVLEWTSPTKRRYSDRPPPTVRFVPSPAGSAPPDYGAHPPPF